MFIYSFTIVQLQKKHRIHIGLGTSERRCRHGIFPACELDEDEGHLGLEVQLLEPPDIGVLFGVSLRSAPNKG